MVAMALVVVNLNIAYARNATEDAMRGFLSNSTDTDVMNEANKLIGEAQSKALTSDIAKYRNCVSFFMEDSFIQLTTDEDCNISQFRDAVSYYKANGYPHESSYMNSLGITSIQLQTARAHAEAEK
jgi:hypothetical protein